MQFECKVDNETVSDYLIIFFVSMSPEKRPIFVVITTNLTINFRVNWLSRQDFKKSLILRGKKNNHWFMCLIALIGLNGA